MKVLRKEKDSLDYDDKVSAWFHTKKWSVFPFQSKAWCAYQDGGSGIVNAPTGSGKTYSLLAPAFSQFFNKKETKGLRVLWITPIRVLSKEVLISAKRLMMNAWKSENHISGLLMCLFNTLSLLRCLTVSFLKKYFRK